MKRKMDILLNGIFKENPVLILVLGCCSVLAISVTSYTAPAPGPVNLNGLNFRCLDANYRRENRESWNWIDVTASVAIVGLLVALYAYFWTWLD
mgnify:CR=1 FL=1